jgi:hypothetical protein
MSQASTQQICVLCGVRAATTSDHIPPKSIFPKPRPSDLITVPACFHCNNSSSRHDEEFRVFLSAQIGMGSEATRKLWKHDALRTLHHNRRLRDHVVNRSWLVDVRTPAGVYLGQRRVLEIPFRAYNSVINRTVRGLYYHHFGKILGRRVACQVKTLHSVPSELKPIVQRMSLSSVGNDALFYRFSRAEDSPLDSMWFLLFYDRYCVFAETRRKSRSNPALNADAGPGDRPG